jgi:hypothetical protein
MRTVLVWLAMLAFHSFATAAEQITPRPGAATTVVAQKQQTARAKTARQEAAAPTPTKEERRCAYVGRWGVSWVWFRLFALSSPLLPDQDFCFIFLRVASTRIFTDNVG